MATQAEAVAWLQAQNGKKLDYDHRFGMQCVDFFNFYYQFLTGRNPYSDGYAVPGAKDLWNVPTNHFIKIPDSSALTPQPGDSLVYGASWGSGYGHVEVCLISGPGGSRLIGENEHGNSAQGVVEVYRTYPQMRGLLGAMRPHWTVAVPQPTGGTATVLRPTYVRSEPNTSAPLAGSKELNKGETFQYSRKVAGQLIDENGIRTNVWYLSSLGHYVWSGNCRG